MKIYFYRYGSICEPDVIDSFKRLGLDVDEETIEISNKNLLPGECVSIVSPKLMNNNYTFVFTINFFHGFLMHARLLMSFISALL